jgi:hypothetical protein
MELRFLEIGVENTISDSDINYEPWEDGEDFESQSKIIKLIEGETECGQKVDIELVKNSVPSIHESLKLWDLEGL